MSRKVVYVTTQGARIQRADGMVAVALDRAMLDRWNPADLERILVFGNVQVTTQVLSLLFQHGVSVSFLTSGGRYRGQIVSPESGNVFVRLAQHARYLDGPFRLEFARKLVHDKLRSGRASLRRHARNHPDTAEAMEKGATAIGQSLRLLERAAELNVMRGAEGAAAAAYFRAFDRMVRQPFVFERRSQHPAHNGVNALLNLGYTLLSQEIAGRAETVGLDPRIGYFHGVRYGRSSLALDLLEPFRVDVVDRLTLSALNRRVFSPDDFVDFGRPKGVRLTPRALKRYLSHYEGSLSEPGAKGETPRARVQRAVTELRNAVMAGQTHGLDLEPVDGVAEASDAP